LKLNYNQLLSNVAFDFNLRPCMEETLLDVQAELAAAAAAAGAGRQATWRAPKAGGVGCAAGAAGGHRDVASGTGWT